MDFHLIVDYAFRVVPVCILNTLIVAWGLVMWLNERISFLTFIVVAGFLGLLTWSLVDQINIQALHELGVLQYYLLGAINTAVFLLGLALIFWSRVGILALLHQWRMRGAHE